MKVKLCRTMSQEYMIIHRVIATCSYKRSQPQSLLPFSEHRVAHQNVAMLTRGPVEEIESLLILLQKTLTRETSVSVDLTAPFSSELDVWAVQHLPSFIILSQNVEVPTNITKHTITAVHQASIGPSRRKKRLNSVHLIQDMELGHCHAVDGLIFEPEFWSDFGAKYRCSILEKRPGCTYMARVNHEKLRLYNPDHIGVDASDLGHYFLREKVNFSYMEWVHHSPW